MTTIDLRNLELLEVWSKADPLERVSFAFPISADSGATGASLAYAELSPGGAIPPHIDSANEIVLVLEGAVQVEVDGETQTMAPGNLVQITSGSRHRVANTSNGAARIVHFFDQAADTVTFDDPLMPLDTAVIG
jgi:quercetin dioxygenase-like cupin family protein